MLTHLVILCCCVIYTAQLEKKYEAKGVEPRFNVVAKNVTVVTGQTAVLPCSVDFLGEFKVVWLDHRDKLLTFEDRRIIADERISLERPYVKEWNLHIRNVKPSDQGTYSCQINTDPVQVRPIRLHVHVPARINRQLSTDDITAKEGETVSLVCNATGVPSPTVTWFRILSGLRDKSEAGKERIGVEGEVLLIYNVTRYCDDVYECVAFNNVPPADSKRMRVNVEFPPEIRLPNKKIGQSRGKETILECIVQAYPIGVTEWKRNGKKIDQSWKYRSEVYEDDRITITLSLRIMDIGVEDYGIYTCEAENLLGGDAEEMQLYEYPKYIPPTSTPRPTTTRLIDSDIKTPYIPPTYKTLAPPTESPPYKIGTNWNLKKENGYGVSGKVYVQGSGAGWRPQTGVWVVIVAVCVLALTR
ncbi:limbic system-associated membrane protein-like isoform X2 [Haliotis cracherodii]|uniref:limbic system-associated membrane protein-like isoform X2 n=1 Tax=Haliotis cracherodii TaxID=6455 RepID=UPI0039EC14BA